MGQLTSNSYAVLGLLSIRPWSAYELSKQVKRSMAFYWPQAERGIYYEPKKLLAAGLATASTEANGKRTRTVYTITRKGRRALTRWLSQPSPPPQFESEAMVRVLFAESGTKDDLLAAIRSVRQHAAALRAAAEEVVRGYVEDEGPFPERLHVIALTGRFNLSYIAMLEGWADWAQSVVDDWHNTASADVFPDAPGVFREFLQELTAPSPGT